MEPALHDHMAPSFSLVQNTIYLSSSAPTNATILSLSLSAVAQKQNLSSSKSDVVPFRIESQESDLFLPSFLSLFLSGEIAIDDEISSSFVRSFVLVPSLPSYDTGLEQENQKSWV